MRKLTNAVKMAAASLTGLMIIGTGSCLPDNYWADTVASGVTTDLVNRVLALVGIEI